MNFIKPLLFTLSLVAVGCNTEKICKSAKAFDVVDKKTGQVTGYFITKVGERDSLDTWVNNEEVVQERENQVLRLAKKWPDACTTEDIKKLENQVSDLKIKVLKSLQKK